MRILLFLSLWLVATNLSGQLSVHMIGGSAFVWLPTSDYEPVRARSLGERLPFSFSFSAGLELIYTRPKNSLPLTFGVKRGIIIDTDLSADFRGTADRCKDGIPAETTAIVAQARLERADFWQIYGKVGVAKVPEWRQMTISLGGGALLFSRQLVHQAISQLDDLNERAEAPSCDFGFAIDPNRQLITTPTVGAERLDLGQPLLRPTTLFGEIEVAFSAGKELQMALNGQFGFTQLANRDLFSDGSRAQSTTSRLNNRRWLAIGLTARGRIF